MKLFIRYSLRDDLKKKILSTKESIEITEDITEAEIFLGWYISREEFLKAKNLKWIQSTSAGIDNILYPEVINSDVIITTASGVHPKPIAEHVFGLILCWTRRINIAFKGKLEKRWEKDNINLCDELTGKVMGILGYGKIGQEIGRIAKCFGMKVIGVKKDIQDSDLNVIPDELYPYSKVSEVLRISDILVLALPLAPETRDFIGEEELKIMKKDAILVNIGRGKTIDEKALIKALKESWIQAALLDVFYEEPLPFDSPLWNLENVIITPHIAGMTPYYDERMVDIFVSNLRVYPDISKMINVVDKKLGY
ncbi:MAG: D-2-hydroxyacid dehydrogenase [Dictyoglomaceae bacterium]|nr:D-2-hydroxyacid dehydrogenase [Dictyoglomaceae bacterium]HPU43278.1 D-2-hydroxyacid dehydrogenase [Dictyoglomaceae bacterium]